MKIFFYVHIPFCEQLCWFCTCSKTITGDYKKVSEYLEYLYKEIDLLEKSILTVGLEELLAYKYILSVEGNDKDSGINWKLDSKSLVNLCINPVHEIVDSPSI